jgi:hypothetical protein
MQDSAPAVWHPEVISEAAQRLLRQFVAGGVAERFYLAGETALALQLGHRRSLDLDFFASQAFDPDLLVQCLQGLAGFTLIAKDAGTLDTHISGIKVSFLSYEYPVLFPLKEYAGIGVAESRDIACMKISAIAGRGTKRDFIDLYAVSQHYPLPRLLQHFKEKFARASYNLVHVAKSLAYFEDAERDPMPDMLAPLSWEEVKQFFHTEARRLLPSGFV